jgi:hypothetical protein
MASQPPGQQPPSGGDPHGGGYGQQPGGYPQQQQPGGYPQQQQPGGYPQEQQYGQQPAPQGGAGGAYPVKRPVGRVVLFTILSLGLYGFYWLYTTRKQLDQQLGDGRDDAVLHTVGFIVPILNFFIVYWLWRDLNDLRVRRGLEEFPVILYLVLTILIPFAAIFTYISVLGKLNEYWDAATNGQATTAPVTTAEKIIVALGVLYFLFWIVIIIVIIVAAASTSSSSVTVDMIRPLGL